MRIGMPTTSFPRDARDSAGRFVFDLAARLAERGHTVEVLSPEPAEVRRLPELPRGVSLRWVPYLRPRALERTFYRAGVLENLVIDPLAWPGLVTHPIALVLALREAMPRWDAVVSHWALPCGLAAAWTAGDRPHAVVVHSGDAHLLARLPGRAAIARTLARGSRRIFASSEATRALFEASLGETARIEVLPMGSDEEPVEEAERTAARSALSIDRFLALSVARLVPIKRIDVAIDAAAELDLTLALAGDGPLRAELSARAQKKRLDARFLGTVGPSERRRWLAASDALVLASSPLASGRTEGTPVSVLESLAAGVPVIASATGGIPDVVRHEDNGLLVQPGDPRSLARALARLIHEPSLADRLRAGARARGAPTMRHTAARIEDALGG